MGSEVEISSIDLRYEGYRMKNPTVEQELLASIAEHGISDPLEGVDTGEVRILLNGFKRYRCAIKLGIGIVPYTSLGDDEAGGIIQLIRISNNRSLSILEQAGLIDELLNRHKMSIAQIADSLSRSKSWVYVRIGIMEEMSATVREKIFSAAFPTYSYMYTLRHFIRIECAKKNEIDEFVNAVSGRKLSIRDIERLAWGYFKGPDEFRAQIKSGNIMWGLKSLKEVPGAPEDCNEYERGMLRDLVITQKYMQRVMSKAHDRRYRNNSFYSQANLMAAGILSKISIFSRILSEFYDRTSKA